MSSREHLSRKAKSMAVTAINSRRTTRSNLRDTIFSVAVRHTPPLKTNRDSIAPSKETPRPKQRLGGEIEKLHAEINNLKKLNESLKEENIMKIATMEESHRKALSALEKTHRLEVDMLVEGVQALSKEVQCSICLKLIKDAVQLHCSHMFCQECIWDWLEKPGVDSCPNCRKVILGVKSIDGLDNLTKVIKEKFRDYIF